LGAGYFSKEWAGWRNVVSRVVFFILDHHLWAKMEKVNMEEEKETIVMWFYASSILFFCGEYRELYSVITEPE
jgi:hypothetical protein